MIAAAFTYPLTPFMMSDHWKPPVHGTTRLPATPPERRSLQARVLRLDNAVHHGGARPLPVRYLVFHDTAGNSGMSSIIYLNTTTEKVASYHYIIERTGQILRMTDPAIIAYHAGDSAWPSPIYAPPGNGGRSVNRDSIGIAWANLGDGTGLTDPQIESGLWLTSVYADVAVSNILGHYEVSPGRKTDPTPAILMEDWRALVSMYRLPASRR